MSQGRTVRLFLVEGTATGMITAEVMNWTGHVLLAPRQSLGSVLKRDEASRTGVYFLIGEDPEQPTRLRVYVGEGDTVAERLKVHANDESKDFWTQCCLVTSKDTNLTKAHVRYIESRLVQIIKDADRANMANGVEPSSKQLPESDIADMEFFLEQIGLILPVIGFDFLRIRRPQEVIETPASHQNFTPLSSNSSIQSEAPPLQLVLKYPSRGIDASAYMWGKELIVEANSTATTETYASNTYGVLRQQLIDDGRLSLSGAVLRFSQDVTFASPSAAAAVILNRNANGRTEWMLRNSHQTLREWQTQQLDTDQ